MISRIILTIVILVSVFSTLLKAGDKEDVMSAVQSTIDALIKSIRESMVVIKQNGKWLTAHMHFSAMF